jgi:hypothetical protein
MNVDADSHYISMGIEAGLSLDTAQYAGSMVQGSGVFVEFYLRQRHVNPHMTARMRPMTQ